MPCSPPLRQGKKIIGRILVLGRQLDLTPGIHRRRAWGTHGNPVLGVQDGGPLELCSRPVRDPVSRKRKDERHRRKDTKVIPQPPHRYSCTHEHTHSHHAVMDSHTHGELNEHNSFSYWVTWHLQAFTLLIMAQQRMLLSSPLHRLPSKSVFFSVRTMVAR